MILKQFKYLLFFLLTFLFGAQSTYAKTEPTLPQNLVYFSVEQNQSFNSLEKEVQPNIGFLKEKSKFGKSESVSAQNQYEFSENFIGKVANAVVKFTSKQIDDYVLLATKQGNQSKVMLGKFEINNPNSYNIRAGSDYAYFDMGPTNWTEAEALVGGSVDEMWRINKKFIDNRKALGNEFYLSHNPANPNYYKGFYKMEIDYLTNPISQGGLGGEIIDLGNNLWKVVW